MSIHVYTGTPGSGKSVHAARDIRYGLNWSRPRRVIANFPLGKNAPVPEAARESYTYIPNAEMSAARITDLASEHWQEAERFTEDAILLVLDECQLLFNARRWSERNRMEYLEFLSQSRKYGIKVVLIAQSAKMIDNQFRMLIEVEHNHRRIASMGPVGAAVAFPFHGALSLSVRYLFQTGERLGMDLIRPTRKDFGMYDSYARFERQES